MKNKKKMRKENRVRETLCGGWLKMPRWTEDQLLRLLSDVQTTPEEIQDSVRNVSMAALASTGRTSKEEKDAVVTAQVSE